MIKTLLENQRDYLNHFFDAIDVSQIEAVFAKVLACKGTVILSGVGKSGHIAQKITATLVSTGTKASFLSPSHALHGDIGSLSSEDIFLAFSKSGASQELLDLLPYVQKKKVPAIAIVSQVPSRLSQHCCMTVCLPVKKELCPYNLAPTTSAAVQLIFGDCLAVGLMQAKQFTIKDFASNHPAGLLGLKITLKVSDLMIQGEAIPHCKKEDKLIDLLHILSMKRCGCLAIVDPQFRLEGIFTDGDLRRAIQMQGADALQRPIGALMTLSPETISPDALAFAAMERMEKNPQRLITALPVIEENVLVGLIRLHDIIQAGLR
jgi:arabinose-5-phosphate isomerase